MALSEKEVHALLSSKQGVIMGMPVAPIPGMKQQWKPYKDSVQLDAHCCGRRVWIGPVQRQLQRTRLLPVVCPICAYKEMGSVEAVKAAMQVLTDKRMGE